MVTRVEALDTGDMWTGGNAKEARELGPAQQDLRSQALVSFHGPVQNQDESVGPTE